MSSQADDLDKGVVTDEGLAELTRKFQQEGIPEDPPDPEDKEPIPYLPDNVVYPVQEKMWFKYPILAKYVAMFATTSADPGWEGRLPDGTYGISKYPTVQFIIMSKHPRPVQRKYDIPHVSLATAWKQAWDEAQAERRHYVTGEDPEPVEKVFGALAWKHAEDLRNFEEMI